MIDRHPGDENHLLASLPAADRRRLGAVLQRVQLQRGALLCEPGLPLRHMYFPTGVVVSLLAVKSAGAPTEVALVGREGAVGVSIVLGGANDALRAEVHVEGEAWRVPAAALRSEFERGGAVQRILLRYAQALMTQMAQAVVCNRHHSVEQALCRWLLMIGDRVGGDDLHVTQQLIADSVGVRREAITEAAGRLQGLGCIQWTRGRVSIADREALKRRSCECYAVVDEEFASCDRQCRIGGADRDRAPGPVAARG